MLPVVRAEGALEQHVEGCLFAVRITKHTVQITSRIQKAFSLDQLLRVNSVSEDKPDRLIFMQTLDCQIHRNGGGGSMDAKLRL